MRVASETVLSGDWVHVVAVRDREAKQLKLYFNGELQAIERPDEYSLHKGRIKVAISRIQESW